MNRHWWIVVLISFILLATTVSIVLTVNTLNDLKQSNIHLFQELEYCKAKAEALLDREKITLSSQNAFLEDIILDDIDRGLEFKLSTLVGHSPKLVYRFYESSCIQCIEDELDFLYKVGLAIDFENIVVLTGYDYGIAKSMVARKNIPVGVYSIDRQANVAFDSEGIDQNSDAVFFVLDRDMRVKLFHMGSGDDEISKLFLNSLKRFFTAKN